MAGSGCNGARAPAASPRRCALSSSPKWRHPSRERLSERTSAASPLGPAPGSAHASSSRRSPLLRWRKLVMQLAIVLEGVPARERAGCEKGTDGVRGCGSSGSGPKAAPSPFRARATGVAQPPDASPSPALSRPSSSSTSTSCASSRRVWLASSAHCIAPLSRVARRLIHASTACGVRPSAWAAARSATCTASCASLSRHHSLRSTRRQELGGKAASRSSTSSTLGDGPAGPGT